MTPTKLTRLGVRLHSMLMPGKTACGVVGRTRMNGKRAIVITEGDLVLRIAKTRRSVTCERCLRAIGRHGEPLPWPTRITPRSTKYLRRHRSRTADTKKAPAP